MKAARALLILAALFAAGTARAQFVPGADTPQPPPPLPKFEAVPPKPGPEFVWTGGHWVWDGLGWRWIRGRYRSRYLARDIYTPGYWQRHQNGGYRWVPSKMR